MNRIKQTWLTFIVVFVAGCVNASERIESHPQTITNGVPLAGLANNLLYEMRDFRLAFYATSVTFSEFLKRGTFQLLGDGVPEHAMEVSTNECRTVGDALSKYAPTGFGERRQIRVVQKDIVVQSPLPRSEHLELRSNLLGLRLNPGDVVLVTRRE
jgi:hypothetical protein